MIILSYEITKFTIQIQLRVEADNALHMIFRNIFTIENNARLSFRDGNVIRHCQ